MKIDRLAHPSRLLALSGLSLALVLAACGSSSKTSTGSAASSPSSTNASSSTSPASGPAVVSVATNSTLGKVLVDPQGMSLYVFDKDSNGMVACTGGCVQVWHPLLLPSGTTTPSGGPGVTAALAVITRPDGGGAQVTLAGRPLYTYVGDKAPGDVAGNGVGGIWHVALPAGNPAGGGSATTSTTNGSGYGY